MVTFIIDSCKFGSIVINGKEYHNDLILTQTEIISGWRRKESHLLLPEDIAGIDLEKAGPVFIGTGWSKKMKLAEETKKLLEELNVPLVIMRTPVAVNEYNRFAHINKIGMFHLTC